jgi:superfamily I DNA/RNA helicase
LNRTPTIDFDDQIYMSTLFGGSFTRFSVILVDEAQDLSPLQHHMVRRSLASGGRVISVGDRRQAIYGFRGADSSSMDSLAAMFPGEFLPLTMSFRCPQTVVLEAQKVAPEIRPWPGADLGTVDTLPKWRPASIESRSVVLCRTNAPLLKVAWEILASGRGVSVLGTDIGKGLIRLIDKLSPTSMPTISFLSVLDAWAAGEIAARPNVEAKISDKVESIRALSGQCATTDDLKSLINRLFSDQTSMITLSSIHKSKGLEWPHVWFLDSWRIPSPFARQPWEREQELNAKYVGITRAQSALTYINAADIEET